MLKPLMKTVLRPGYRRLSTGLRDAVAALAAEWTAHRIHRAGRRKSATYFSKTHLKLNIGCGPNIKDEWVNIDLAPGADLTLDVRAPIPLKDGCCSMIYSEHFFEHLQHPRDTTRFLSEAFRLLEPGGVFSVDILTTKTLTFRHRGRRHAAVGGAVPVWKGWRPASSAGRAATRAAPARASSNPDPRSQPRQLRRKLCSSLR